jgi:hypothetical protein
LNGDPKFLPEERIKRQSSIMKQKCAKDLDELSPPVQVIIKKPFAQL